MIIRFLILILLCSCLSANWRKNYFTIGGAAYNREKRIDTKYLNKNGYKIFTEGVITTHLKAGLYLDNNSILELGYSTYENPAFIKDVEAGFSATLLSIEIKNKILQQSTKSFLFGNCEIFGFLGLGFDYFYNPYFFRKDLGTGVESLVKYDDLITHYISLTLAADYDHILFLKDVGLSLTLKYRFEPYFNFKSFKKNGITYDDVFDEWKTISADKFTIIAAIRLFSF